MTRGGKWIAGALAIASGLALGVAATAQQQPPPRPEIGPGGGAAGYAPVDLARVGGEFDLGRRTYERYCIGCHGAAGDGKGEAAPFLDPKPRDFTRALYKFVTVPGGQLPRDEDLLRTVTQGLRGTSMPSFRFVPEEERRAVVRYLKSFAADRWESPPGQAVARGLDPYDPSLDFPRPIDEAIAKGREVYHVTFGCQGCHPAYVSRDEYAKLTGGNELRRDADRPILTEDSWENWIPAPDFKRQPLRVSHGVGEIYTTITAGIGGAAMPTMASLPNEQRWQLAYYVKSLTDERGKMPGPPPPPIDPRGK